MFGHSLVYAQRRVLGGSGFESGCKTSIYYCSDPKTYIFTGSDLRIDPP